MAVAAVVGGREIAHLRVSMAATLPLQSVTLTAEPVAVQSLSSGLVVGVAVHAGQHVTVGQRLGRLLVLTTVGTRQVPTTETLTAPLTGIVADAPLAGGNTLQVGETFVDLYDPAKLTLQTNVTPSQLHRLAPGMRATLRTAGLAGPITAVVEQVVPRMDQVVPRIDQTGGQARSFTVVLRPTDPAAVAGLLPGLRFTGSITLSGGDHGKSAIRVTP